MFDMRVFKASTSLSLGSFPMHPGHRKHRRRVPLSSQGIRHRVLVSSSEGLGYFTYHHHSPYVPIDGVNLFLKQIRDELRWRRTGLCGSDRPSFQAYRFLCNKVFPGFRSEKCSSDGQVRALRMRRERKKSQEKVM